MFFFFQAEDGIRDLTVTGVQTCALPIFVEVGARQALAAEGARPVLGEAVDEPVALGGEAPCLPDEVGQPRGHAPSAARAPARYRGGSPRTVRSTRTGRRAWDGTCRSRPSGTYACASAS